MNFNRVAVILRGVSGSSKSTFADYLGFLSTWFEKADYCGMSCVICTADDYFMENGQYTFRAEKLGFAHAECQRKFIQALKDGAELVICANTNSTDKEANFYVDAARENGYTCFVIVMEKRHDCQNSHGVSSEVIDRQELRLRGSLKLK